jgi:hypothetical protein
MSFSGYLGVKRKSIWLANIPFSNSWEVKYGERIMGLLIKVTSMAENL